MDKLNAENKTLAFILKGPGETEVKRIPVIRIPGPSLRVKMKACGICGSDIRYYQGENPWSLHTLGRNIPSPPKNIVLIPFTRSMSKLTVSSQPTTLPVSTFNI